MLPSILYWQDHRQTQQKNKTDLSAYFFIVQRSDKLVGTLVIVQR
jgi:hypothetical protein